jgi:hypothetical protein
MSTSIAWRLVGWPLNVVGAKRDAAKKEVGIDAQQQQKYDDLQRTVAQQEIAVKRLDD